MVTGEGKPSAAALEWYIDALRGLDMVGAPRPEKLARHYENMIRLLRGAG